MKATRTPISQQPSSRSAEKDGQRVDAEWRYTDGHLEGVRVREVRNVVTRNGITTELFRPDWDVVDGSVEHMIHVALRPGAISAWHMHEHQTDHIFVVGGQIRLALFDDREDSSSRGQVELLHLSPMRPQLVVVPPRVWHGLQSLGPDSGCFVNFFDRPYLYEDPDEWRLPPDTPDIPYRFSATTSA